MFGPIMYFCIWAPLNVMRRIWWRWRVEGLENLPTSGQGFIVAANHLDWMDIPIVGASLPLRYRPWWMAKIELFTSRFAIWWFSKMRVIPIKRGKRDLSAFIACEKALKEGGALIIFPEGHRSETGALQEAKGGIVRLSVRSGCPIVPVAIWGTEHGLRGMMRREQVTVRFGMPFYPDVEGSHIPWDRMNELTDESMLQIAALLPEHYWGFYREHMLKKQHAQLEGEH